MNASRLVAAFRIRDASDETVECKPPYSSAPFVLSW
jgi:hypothetical protein